MNVPVERRLALLAAKKSPRFLIVSKDNGLSAEALAAFGAAGVDDPAATDGSHASAETVTARADELTGLKGPFHGEYPDVMRLRRAIYKEVGGLCQREKRLSPPSPPGKGDIKEIFSIYNRMIKPFVNAMRLRW